VWEVHCILYSLRVNRFKQRVSAVKDSSSTKFTTGNAWLSINKYQTFSEKKIEKTFHKLNHLNNGYFQIANTSSAIKRIQYSEISLSYSLLVLVKGAEDRINISCVTKYRQTLQYLMTISYYWKLYNIWDTFRSVFK